MALLAQTPLFCQWEDNVWLFGYRFFDLPPNVSNGFYLNFNKGDTLTSYYQNTGIEMSKTNSFLCDSNGVLNCISNGCFITDGEFNKIPNGMGLNPGFLADQFCMGIEGYNIPNSMISMYDPSDSKIVHFFHHPLVLEDNWFYHKNLLHTVVDLAANNGQGMVLEKNTPIVYDSISGHGIAAVRHGNGRDWWVLAKKEQRGVFFVAYLGPDTVAVQSQDLGEGLNRQVFGEMVFSPDGSKLALYDPKHDLHLYDFDRCSGQLSNPIHLDMVDPDSIQNYGGLAWSADGHYLYCSSILRVYQFDMWASDWAATKTVVALRNSGGCPNDPGLSPVSLSYMELMPDGRILSKGLSTYLCMHIMQHPERQGEGCQMEQGVLALDIAIDNMPNFPNFRLGPLDGSVCDTLGLDNHPLAGWRYDRTGGTAVDFTSVSWYAPTWWHWDFGDGSGASTERNPAHTFPSPGAYEVCLTVGNAYGTDTKCKTVWVPVSGTQAPGVPAPGLRLYPNPSTGLVYWDVSGVQRVRVYDALGRAVADLPAADGRADLSALPHGLYRVQLLNESGAVLGVAALGLF